MKSFKNYILGEAEAETKIDVKDTENEDESKEDKGDLVPVDQELKEIIADLTDEEKEVLLAHAYALIFNDMSDEDFDSKEGESEEGEDEDELEEASIEHLSGKERTAGRLKRRAPRWKRRARIRYIKNKKCPMGTTFSTKTKSCTRKNIDMSRIQKLISRMKIRTK